MAEISVTPGRNRRAPAVFVGVDGSERNRPAVRWATREAARAHTELRLLAVASEATILPHQLTREGALDSLVAETRALVERVHKETLPTWDQVTVEVLTGHPAQALRRPLQPGDVLVLGRGGRGAVERALVGSTSLQVAGRADDPCVVVPDDWDEDAHVGQAIVAGVDWTERDAPVLDFAFARAAALGVPLAVVGAWWAPRQRSWELTPDDTEYEADLARHIAAWSDRYPGVVLDVSVPVRRAGDALLAAARDSQLVVLGRHARLGAHGRFSAFSTCREVLQHATCPVAIVPTGRIGDTRDE